MSAQWLVLAVAGLSLSACILQAEVRTQIAPLLRSMRRGLYNLTLRQVLETRQYARSIARYRRELDLLTPRSLIEDILLFTLMSAAFYLGVNLSYWIAGDSIQSVFDRLGIESTEPFKELLDNYRLLIGAVIGIEVFCGILLLDLAGGTNLFGVVSDRAKYWRYGLAIVLVACFVSMVYLDRAITHQTLKHLQAVVAHRATSTIRAYPAAFMVTLRTTVEQILSRPITEEAELGVFSFTIAVVLAIILFPLDVLKDIFPLLTFIALFGKALVFTAALFALLLALCAFILLSTVTYRILVFPARLYADARHFLQR